MTTDFGYVDIKEQYFAPLPLAMGHRKSLITTITQIMVAFGARPSEVLSIYTDSPVMWEIPSLYSDRLISSALTVSASERREKGEGAIYNAFKEAVVAVDAEGFRDRAAEIVSSVLGKGALHPLLFTRSGRGPGATALFGLEWACLLYHNADQAVFQDNQAFVRLSADYLTPPMGVIGGVCGKSEPVTAEFLEEHKTRSRGYINLHTFDALDRANIWVMQNFAYLEEPEKILRGLCLLKLSQNPRVAYEFEQALHNLVQPVMVEPSLRSLIYTDESLDMIRSIWYDHDTPNKEKFDLLHTQLVPMYLDDMQFKQLFKYMPADVKRFSYKMERDVNAGLEKFVALFLQTRRAIASGKRVVME